MEKNVRVALEKRFSEAQVKQRRGSFGKSIVYVDGSAIVARLNECFDADWNFTILEYETLITGEVLVHGRLAAFGVTKEAFGRGMPAVSIPHASSIMEHRPAALNHTGREIHPEN